MNFAAHLPLSFLGLQLEPAIHESDKKSYGLRLKKDWVCEDGDFNIRLSRGSVITTIDGRSIDDVPFQDAIEMLRKSNRRYIQCQPFDVENCKPNATAVHETKSPKQTCASPLRSPLSTRTSNSIFNDNRCKKMIKTSMDDELLTDTMKVESDKTRQMYLESVEVSLRKEQEILHLNNEVANLKSQTRGLDGQIMLLKFQLGKQKKESKNAARPEDTSSPDRHSWILHWKRMQDNLHLLRRTFEVSEKSNCVDRINRVLLNQSTGTARGDLNSTSEASFDSEEKNHQTFHSSETEGDLVKSLQVKLAVQENFSRRLQLQMHTWMNTQIENHRIASENDVLSLLPSIERKLVDSPSSICSTKASNEIIQKSARTPITQLLGRSSTTSPRILKQIFDGFASTEATQVLHEDQHHLSSMQKTENNMENENEVLAQVEEGSANVESVTAASIVESLTPIAVKTPISLQRSSVPYGSAEIRSAWKAWGASRFTEVASSSTVNPSKIIFSPASISPTSFHDQMTRLRKENMTIRDEISRFRNSVKMMQQEVNRINHGETIEFA